MKLVEGVYDIGKIGKFAIKSDIFLNKYRLMHTMLRFISIFAIDTFIKSTTMIAKI